MIRVAVAGAAGRMGQAVCAAVQGAPDMELSGRADPLLETPLAGGAARRRTCVVDFTGRRSRSANTLACVHAGRARGDRHDRLRPGRAAPGSSNGRRGARTCWSRPNFAIGAVLMMRFAARGGAAHGQGARSSSCTTTASSTRPSGTAARTAAADGRRPAAGRSRRSTRCACPAWSPTRR